MRLRLLLSVVVLLLAMTGEAFSEPKRVMLLHSFGRDFAPWNEYAKVVREELGRQSKEPIDIFEASLATARFAEDEEGPFVDYLHALFVKRKLDLVISIGAPAANFLQRHRQTLFPSVPAVYTGVEQRRVSVEALTQNDAVVAVSLDLAGAINNILNVLPETTSVVIAIGNSPIEKYWQDQMRDAFRPFEGRVSFTCSTSAQPCCLHDPRFSLGCCRWTRRVSHTKRGRRYPEFTRSPTPLCSVIRTRFLAKGLSGGRCRSWLTSRDRPRASLFAS